MTKQQENENKKIGALYIENAKCICNNIKHRCDPMRLKNCLDYLRMISTVLNDTYTWFGIRWCACYC